MPEPFPLNDIRSLLKAIALVGRAHPKVPNAQAVERLASYYSDTGLDRGALERSDGSLTRREILSRFLLLSVVLDQGPDITGIRFMVLEVLNALYRQGIPVLHEPSTFFANLSAVRRAIASAHDEAASRYGRLWAEVNQSNPEKYNLFTDNSRQILGYMMFRWGTPLALCITLQQDHPSPSPLLDYLESFPSAELMSQGLKDSRRYGLGKAIGDKACHLYAKWLCSSLRISRRTDTGWGDFSYEVPFDSNAGRVLWRTGFFQVLASEDNYEKWDVLQPGAGKGKTTYIRVTNVRGKPVKTVMPPEIIEANRAVSVDHFRTHKAAPHQVQIQRLPHAVMLLGSTDLGPADLDEGLIHIGTNYCFNTDSPRCTECPVKGHCQGYLSHPALISEYRT